MSPTSRIAPSLLSADFGRLDAEIDAVAAAGADWIHVDVMDGRFVPNLTVGAPVVRALRDRCPLPLDCHLMVVEPERLVPAFLDAGAAVITVHVEATTHLQRTLQMVRDGGAKAGVALNPHTPEETLRYVLGDVDLVLVMSVNPGFGGQSFLPAVLPKITAIRKMIASTGRDIALEVDGGIRPGIAREVRQAGANTFVAGSAIFGAESYQEAIEQLRRDVC